MVIAHHLIWTAYGWWLPNDPRGSTSNLIRNDILRELGELHFGRKQIQPAASELREFFEKSRTVLKHPLLEFDFDARRMIGAAFSETIRQNGYTCFACAIMPDHVHLVIRRHRDRAELMIANFQRDSHLKLRDLGMRDLEHPVWGGHGWKVFLDTPDEIRRTNAYVRGNPIKIGHPAQEWEFVTPYDGWKPASVRIIPNSRPNR